MQARLINPSELDPGNRQDLERYIKQFDSPPAVLHPHKNYPLPGIGQEEKSIRLTHCLLLSEDKTHYYVFHRDAAPEKGGHSFNFCTDGKLKIDGLTFEEDDSKIIKCIHLVEEQRYINKEARAIKILPYMSAEAPIHDKSLGYDCSFIVMNKLPGERLDRVLAKNDLTIQQRFLYTKQLLRCLIALRNLDLVHRDIKPSNCLASANTAHIIDFSEARFKEDISGPDAIHDEEKREPGTPEYAAPERFLLAYRNSDAKEHFHASVKELVASYEHPETCLNEQTDIYILGLTLLEVWGARQRRQHDDETRTEFKNGYTPSSDSPPFVRLKSKPSDYQQQMIASVLAGLTKQFQQQRLSPEHALMQIMIAEYNNERLHSLEDVLNFDCQAILTALCDADLIKPHEQLHCRKTILQLILEQDNLGALQLLEEKLGIDVRNLSTREAGPETTSYIEAKNRQTIIHLKDVDQTQTDQDGHLPPPSPQQRWGWWERGVTVAAAGLFAFATARHFGSSNAEQLIEQAAEALDETTKPF